MNYYCMGIMLVRKGHSMASNKTFDNQAPHDPSTIRQLYGRRQGHKLRPQQIQLVKELLPQISVSKEGPITAQTLFGSDRPLHFEIGFGAGEHMAARADMLPDHGFIGCEPFLNGMVSALQHIRDGYLPNIRLHMGNALDVLERIPDGTLSFIYLLHPDPWPKARHVKRRIMNDGPVNLIAAKLKQGGEFRFGTDHPIYVRHAMMVMQNHLHQFQWLCEKSKDFQNRPSGWPETRYEAKARKKGHEVWYFRYRKIIKQP